jgi:hypothetical protein
MAEDMGWIRVRCVKIISDLSSLFFRFTGITETVKRTGFWRPYLIWTMEPARNNVHALNGNCLNCKPRNLFGGAPFNCEHVDLRAFPYLCNNWMKQHCIWQNWRRQKLYLLANLLFWRLKHITIALASQWIFRITINLRTKRDPTLTCIRHFYSENLKW